MGLKKLLIFVIIMIPMSVLSDTITLVADKWCPYNCEPGSGKPVYVIEIAREIFKPAGHEIKYINVPWSRALMGVTQGMYDGAIAATPKELPEGIFPEESQGSYSNHFIIRKDEKWQYSTLGSLESITLGAIQDYNYGSELDAYINNNMNTPLVERMSGEYIVKRSLEKLLLGRIDAYLEDENVAFYMAKQMGITDRIKIGGGYGDPIIMYIGFSPKNPKSSNYALLLSKGIRDMRSSGRLQGILDKYGVKDWKAQASINE